MLTSGSGTRRSITHQQSSVFDVLFPMHVVSLVDCLEMTEVEDFYCLREKGLVRPVSPEDGTVIFISHQWVAYDHPDPSMDQFRVFQAAIKRLLAGMDVHPSATGALRGETYKIQNWKERLENTVVWYDYFSIPQINAQLSSSIVHSTEIADSDFKKAVWSIPSYAEDAHYLFVVCPPLEHKDAVGPSGRPNVCDYFSWASRGWCRVEQSIFEMTNPTNEFRPAIVIQSEDIIFYQPNYYGILNPVGQGRLSCCDKNHKITNPDGAVWHIPCDKDKFAPLLEGVVLKRQKRFKTQGNIHDLRISLTKEYFYFIGLTLPASIQGNRHLTLEDFLRLYHFDSIHDGADTGWTPLRFAIISGNSDLAIKMIDLSADIHATIKYPEDEELVHYKGLSILQSALIFCLEEPHLNVLDKLLDARADPHYCFTSMNTKAKQNSLSSAVRLPSVLSMRWLIKKFPDTDLDDVILLLTGHRALGWLASHGDAHGESIKMLLAARADPNLTNARGMCNLHSTAISMPFNGISAPSRSNIYLQAGADINERICYGDMSLKWKFFQMVARITVCCGVEDQMFRGFDMMPGATALMIATQRGNSQLVRFLLASKADTAIRNYRGMTAADLARKNGFTLLVEDIRQAEEEQEICVL